MKTLSIRILLITLLFSAGCATTSTDTVTQTSTIDALLAGVYDGTISCGELLGYGNFGIGTFDRLDGEMIVLDGKVYQVKADGLVYTPSPVLLTPFASVCYFAPEDRFGIEGPADYPAVRETIDKAVPNQNLFCAVKIEGKFGKMKTRSVPAQSKPYPPLAEVTKDQPVFELEDARGTIVGFRCPPFVEGINVPGYHFHFLSDDRTAGGHVLEFTLDEGECEVDVCNRYLLILPEGGEGLAGLDLSRDRSEELEAVER